MTVALIRSPWKQSRHTRRTGVAAGHSRGPRRGVDGPPHPHQGRSTGRPECAGRRARERADWRRAGARQASPRRRDPDGPRNVEGLFHHREKRIVGEQPGKARDGEDGVIYPARRSARRSRGGRATCGPAVSSHDVSPQPDRGRTDVLRTLPAGDGRVADRQHAAGYRPKEESPGCPTG